MSNLSVIQNIKEVHDHPYPYVCVEDALPENLYKELEETFPEELVTSTSPHDGGITYRYKCKEAQDQRVISATIQFLLHEESCAAQTRGH